MSLEERYKNILSNIYNFLNKVEKNNLDETIKEYFLNIEQDAEKLCGMNNDCIINLEIFQKVREIYKILIVLLEEKEFQTRYERIKFIFQDLYFIFKYVFENILFLIENEFLVNN